MNTVGIVLYIVHIATWARELIQSPHLKLGTGAHQTENVNLFHW